MKRSKRFGLTLTEIEKEFLIKLSIIEGGLTLASIVRQLIFQEAKRKGLFVIENEIGEKISKLKEQ